MKKQQGFLLTPSSRALFSLSSWYLQLFYTKHWMSYKQKFVEAHSFSMHTAQVAVSTNKEVDSQIPNYPSLPPQLICQLHNVTMHVSGIEVLLCFHYSCGLVPEAYNLFNQADIETDEVYAQMTLQPLSPVCHSSLSYLGVAYFPVWFLTSFHPCCLFCSKSKKRFPSFQQTWVPPTDSQQITSAKLWRPATPVLMVDFQFRVVQLKKCFHPW